MMKISFVCFHSWWKAIAAAGGNCVATKASFRFLLEEANQDNFKAVFLGFKI